MEGLQALAGKDCILLGSIVDRQEFPRGRGSDKVYEHQESTFGVWGGYAVGDVATVVAVSDFQGSAVYSSRVLVPLVVPELGRKR